jgi:hypothetical protein
VLNPKDAAMLYLDPIIDRLRTASVVVRALALLKGVGPYAAIELLLPGGSLIALGLWLYSRHKRGKPLLPFRLRVRALSPRARARGTGRPAIPAAAVAA